MIEHSHGYTECDVTRAGCAVSGNASPRGCGVCRVKQQEDGIASWESERSAVFVCSGQKSQPSHARVEVCESWYVLAIEHSFMG
jgi:hypothetical protein